MTWTSAWQCLCRLIVSFVTMVCLHCFAVQVALPLHPKTRYQKRLGCLPHQGIQLIFWERTSEQATLGPTRFLLTKGDEHYLSSRPEVWLPVGVQRDFSGRWAQRTSIS